MPILLKDIPDFYTFDSSMQEQDNLSEAGHKEEGSAENIREGSTPEQSGKEIEFDHPSEVGTSSGEHSGNRIDMDHTESHALPEFPESPSLPELPESPDIPEMPELPED